MDPELLRDLYRHARGEDGRRQLFESDPSFATGWVNLDAQRARELVAAFVPLDDADSLKEARRTAQTNLEAQAWNDVLDIEGPPIVCKVKIHGAKWGLRFQSAEPAMRGREARNEDLPPIPASIDNEDAARRSTSRPANPQMADGTAPSERTENTERAIAAEDVLQRGGLPA